MTDNNDNEEKSSRAGYALENERRHPELNRTNERRPLDGIKIKTACFGMLVVTMLVYGLLIRMSYNLQENYQSMLRSTNEYFASSVDFVRVSDASDYLTDQSRLFSIELDRTYVDNYFHEKNVSRRREMSLKDFKSHHMGQEALDYFNKAIKYSNELMDSELYAMRLIIEALEQDISTFPVELHDVQLRPDDAALGAQEKLWRARTMLFDARYQSYKMLIKQNLTLSFQKVQESLGDAHRHDRSVVERNIHSQLGCTVLLIALTMLMFIFIIYFVVQPLYGYMECIRFGQPLSLAGAYEFKYLASTYNSIFERNMANQEMLRHKAEHDFLTGLMNRGAFASISEMLRGSQNNIAMIIIDVDLFKSINDRYGHDTGDKILQKVSRLLISQVRSSDSVFRLGGDEFGVLMTYVSNQEKKMIAEKFGRINDALRHPMDGLPICSISVGVAFSAAGYRDGLYLNADKALYEVKRTHRGGVMFFPEVIG